MIFSFYTAPDGSCVRCSPCCGKPSVYANQFVEKECADAGMLRCSCRALRGCVDRSGDCTRSTVITFKQNTLSSTPATTTTRKQRKQPSTKMFQLLKGNQRLSGGVKSEQECRNKAILRQLRQILSKYKRRVIIKVST